MRMSRPETTVILGLGSNINDREAYIQKALEALRAVAVSPVWKSKVYETEPVGPQPQGKYLNLCARFTTKLNPRQLLDFCLQTEAKLGRIRSDHWGP